MAALVFAPSPRQYVAFPLVFHWQPRYDCLSLYFPDLRFGLLAEPPAETAFTSILAAPPQKGGLPSDRGYRPGELSQWEAYLKFLATQEHQDEMDLKAAIRGQLEPVLTQQLDGEVLWRLAYELEQMLAEQAAGLERLSRQHQTLEAIIGEGMEEDHELAPLSTAFNPPLSGVVPDLTLARVRLRFWRQVLAPHLTTPWAALVLEDAPGEGSPRHLWEAAEGGQFWQTALILPDWRPGPGLSAQDLSSLKMGVKFRKGLDELLQALTDNPGAVEDAAAKIKRLAEAELWPASGLPQAQSVQLAVYGWLQPATDGDFPAEPMVFLSPAD